MSTKSLLYNGTMWHYVALCVREYLRCCYVCSYCCSCMLAVDCHIVLMLPQEQATALPPHHLCRCLQFKHSLLLLYLLLYISGTNTYTHTQVNVCATYTYIYTYTLLLFPSHCCRPQQPPFKLLCNLNYVVVIIVIVLSHN